MEGQVRVFNGALLQLILKPDFNVEELCSEAGGKKKWLKARMPLVHLGPHICSEDRYSLKHVLYHFRIKPPFLGKQPASVMKILILIVC